MLLHFLFIPITTATILYSLYQMAAFWLVYICFVQLFKLNSSSKYWLSVAVQFLSFLFFIFSLFFSKNLITVNINNYWLPIKNSFIESKMLNSTISYSYFTVLSFLLMKFVYQLIKLKELTNNNSLKIDASLKLFVQLTALQLGITKNVKVFITQKIKTPFTVGFLKPIILLPFAAFNNLSNEQIEIVLLHELAHIKRADYFIQIILSVIEATLFFNPFIYFFKKEIERERENCCDDVVLQFKYNQLLYADTLLQLSYLQHLPSFALKINGNKKYLLQRIERITNTVSKNKIQFPVLKILIAILILLLVNLFSLKNSVVMQQKESSFTIAPESNFHTFLFKPIAYNSNINSIIKNSKKTKLPLKKKKELKTADFRFDEPTVVYEDDLNKLFTNTVIAEDSIAQKRNWRKTKKEIIAVPAVSKMNTSENSIIELTSIKNKEEKDTVITPRKVYKILVKKTGKPDEEITIIVE